MLFIVGNRCWAWSEWRPRRYLEVWVQRSRHDQALWRGHRCNGHLCHICGRDIQWLCFTGCPNPPHLSQNKQMLLLFSPKWIQLVQPSVNQHSWDLNTVWKCITLQFLWRLKMQWDKPQLLFWNTKLIFFPTWRYGLMGLLMCFLVATW